MKNLFSIVVVSAFLAASLSTQAAEVKGKVNTNVKAGAIIQANKGALNKNELSMGSITGKSTKVQGKVKSNVKVGAVIQANKGALNKNEAAIGSITD